MIRGVIFDLDGVIVSTDDCHYRGWKRLADEEGIYFDREINERLRGVSRMGSLEILLERATRTYSPEEKEALATRKNGYYRRLLADIGPADILPGVVDVLSGLQRRGIRMAIASSSRNTPMIMDRIGVRDYFDAIVDGNDIERSKPDPEVFLLAAKRIGLAPQDCLVVEDAEAGVTGALAAGMKVLAVGFACRDTRAHARASDLAQIDAKAMIEA